MQCCQPHFVLNIEVGVERHQVGDRIFAPEIASPVQRGAALSVYLIDIHFHFVKKEKQGRRLVTLSSHMKHVLALLILKLKVSVHIDDQDLDDVDVAMVACEVQSCKLLISLLISPYFQLLLSCFIRHVADRQIVANRMLVDQLEAVCVVLESCESEQSVPTVLLNLQDVEGAPSRIEESRQ